MIGEEDAPLGFDEAGIVASTSSRLATADPPISIFYLSAFSYDFVFVPQEVSERALEVLRPAGGAGGAGGAQAETAPAPEAEAGDGDGDS